VLRRLRLKLARSRNERHERYVDKDRIAAAFLIAHLPDRFHKGQRLDVADRSADLNDKHVGLVLFGYGPDRRLDLVGNVWNDLYGLAKVIAPPLFLDNGKIDAAAGPVIRLGELCVGKPFVMPRSRSVSAPSSVTNTSPC
jgi:hypothetical protein